MSRVAHFEIHASDPARTIEFYSALFDWRFEPWGPPGSYWLIRTGDSSEPGIDGGLVPRRGDGPIDGQAVNAYVCTVNVASASGSLAKALSLGGSEALPIMPIPGVGWLCYAKDLDGTIFGLMETDSSAA